MNTGQPTSSRDAMHEQSQIRRIARYVVEARGKCVPDAMRESALKRIYDLLSAVAAGVDEPSPVAVRKPALKVFGHGESPIWFTGARASGVGAAWANSAAASTLDLDDGHRMARGHPGAAVIPAAFAVAQEIGAGVDELITAIAIGYEVGVAIGAARTSYGSTGTWSSYGVVAAAAALRGTTAPVLEHALAIAGESSPNQLFSSMPPFSLPTPEGSDVKEGIPWSVVTGMLALDLAESGFTGPRNILESTLHYKFKDARAYGEAQHLSTSYFKLYCCCRHIHPALDAMLQLLAQHEIDACSIENIVVETYSGALRITNKLTPQTLIDVQYSIPYCLALAAIAGTEMLLPLTTESIGNSAAEKLAEKVQIKLDPEIDKRFPAETLARVTVVSNGQRYTSQVMAPRGEGNDPLSWEELRRKFVGATRLSNNEVHQRRLITAIEDLRVNGDMKLLNRCLGEQMFSRPAGLSHAHRPSAFSREVVDS